MINTARKIIYLGIFIVSFIFAFILINSFKFININNIYIYLISFILSTGITLTIKEFIYLSSLSNFFIELYQNRMLIFSLAKNDFKNKYAGSYFGIIWAFIQPVMTILTFWFVFQLGFKNSSVDDVPFVLWLSSGLIPWFFFSEAWNNSTNSFTEYSYLVKKISFNINILPIIKLISALFVHLFFMVFLLFLFLLYGMPFSIYMIQIFYYMFCLSILVLGLSFISSSIIIFFKDLSQIIVIILQFGIWLTPIMWTIDMVSEEYIWLFNLNPMYYIVDGYRSALFEQEWFYKNIKQTIYFWLITLAILFLGISIYKKLKPHFSDVL